LHLGELTYPGGEIVRYEYYDDGSVRKVTDPKGRVISYEYDPCGRLTKTARANGSVARHYNISRVDVLKNKNLVLV